MGDTPVEMGGGEGPVKIEVTSDLTQSQSQAETEKDLEELVSKRAVNSEDRYRILEARDKILRLSKLTARYNF